MFDHLFNKRENSISKQPSQRHCENRAVIRNFREGVEDQTVAGIPTTPAHKTTTVYIPRGTTLPTSGTTTPPEMNIPTTTTTGDIAAVLKPTQDTVLSAQATLGNTSIMGGTRHNNQQETPGVMKTNTRPCRQRVDMEMGREDGTDIYWPSKNKNKVDMVCMNAQSLLSHKDEIDRLVISKNIDILCITETWFLPSMDDSLVNIQFYNIFRHDHGRGGGACIYVRDCFKVVQIDVNLDKTEGIEDIWVTVQYQNLPSFIIGCVYRHPHAPLSSFNYILDVFRHICLRNKPIFIMGDFNDNLLSTNNKMTKIIKNVKLTQIVNKPTRITNVSATLIDLLITNKPELISFSDVIPSPVADHELIIANLDISKPKKLPLFKTFRCLKSYTPDGFCNLLLDNTHILNKIANTDNIDIQVNILTEIFSVCIDRCAPMVTRKITRPPAPWITYNIKEEMETRNQLQRELKLDRYNITLRDTYKAQKKRVKSLIEKNKKEYYKNQFQGSKDNIAATWKIIRNMLPNDKENSERADNNDLKVKVEEFNEFFANIGKKTYEKTQEGAVAESRYDSVDLYSLDGKSNSFKLSPVDCNTVILTIKNLKDSNSYGSDGIPFRYIKDALPVIVYYLTIIINTSIVTTKYPDSWKVPHVIPLHKGGTSDDVTNYRPISLLPVFSKILEKIVASQLTAFLESNKLLVENQHGFRPKLSTETALLKITDKIYNNIDNKKLSLLILLDLSKAFDSVNHNILINKCIKLNIDPTWFKEYLSNRKQSVRLKNVLSTPRKVSFGVPQGSILGPILFSIYVNDLAESITECLVIQYADDTQVLITGDSNNPSELIKKAESILINIKIYFQKNGLLLNENKTQCILIGSRQYVTRIQDDLKINFNGNVIIPSKTVKNLGVYFDRYMLFDTHIDEMCKKVTGTLMYLSRIKDCFDTPTRVMVVQSLVLSLIYYCTTVWGATNKTQIERVQKLQNFAARVALGGIGKYEHITPALKKLEWLRIEEKCSFDICLLVNKILKKQLPDWLFKLSTVNEIRGTTTRQCDSLFIPNTSTNMGQKMLTVRGPAIWNNIPEQVRNAGSITSLKYRMFKYFSER